MIAAIVVAYFPEAAQLVSLLLKLSKQAQHVVVVDNTPEQFGTPSWLADLATSNIQWIAQGANVGIAEAHNIGIKAAQLSGAEQVILFDQDSQVGDDFILLLSSAAYKLRQQGIKLACIGPRPFCIHANQQSRPRVQRELQRLADVTLVRQIIASGMLIRVADYKDIGPKEAGLFIDGVDHEWCWRAASKGYTVAICESVIMPHKLGDDRGRIIGISYKVGSPIRLYYQFRNTWVLARRSYVPTYWKLRNIVAQPVRFVLMGLFQSPRRLRIRYMLKGVLHGLLKKQGPYK
ncbi:rhamnosyltransferase [Neiella marina]|uniref:Rhamnosyltransferase n=1 Tax=Neiella marina TaxID=508461 RepID=A0A8J2U579_9GAMM|nr:glycosyltransferase family 2 protein [Neiella marina]GGA78551.1 rhamnosyltransferase [Neiella marina]